MSEEQKPTKAMVLYGEIDQAKDKFLSIAASTQAEIDWEKESTYAYQLLTKSDSAIRTALDNPSSVKLSVINVASVGLSLNPATAYAYLVPRDGQICLDISYQGLIKIATDTGSIRWAKAELVYSNDDFQYRGPSEKPIHHADPFAKDRGEWIGVYCVAKTIDGDFLVETMTAEEVDKIRDETKSVMFAKSEAKKLALPWFRFAGEMRKKTVIKRASKTWPKTQHERLQTAIEVLNEQDGIELEEEHRFKPGEKLQIITQMREALIAGDDMTVAQIVEEYKGDDPEETIKFWGLFKSHERRAIQALTDDREADQERVAMGHPELTEPLENLA